MYDWLLATSPQPELNNRTFNLGRGKLLGGTSAMNAMQYTKSVFYLTCGDLVIATNIIPEHRRGNMTVCPLTPKMLTYIPKPQLRLGVIRKRRMEFYGFTEIHASRREMDTPRAPYGC